MSGEPGQAPSAPGTRGDRKVRLAATALEEPLHLSQWKGSTQLERPKGRGTALPPESCIEPGDPSSYPRSLQTRAHPFTQPDTIPVVVQKKTGAVSVAWSTHA